VARPFTLLVSVVLFLDACCLLIWPYWGYEPLFLSLVVSVICLAWLVAGFMASRLEGTKEAEERRPSRVLLVVALVLTAIAAVATANLLTQPRWVGEGQWVECARFATVGPGEAVHLVASDHGLDLLEIHASVRPLFVNETGWAFEAMCDPSPAPGRLVGFGYGETPGVRSLFVWSVSYSHEYELLGGGSVWIAWDTGECLASCKP